MPQAVGVWCEEQGHDVTFVCFTGFENLLEEIPKDLDILFIGAFSQAAQTAYAISNLVHRRGTVTVLGGPHARCYPEDARKYFDYVVGFTDKAIVDEILSDCSRYPEYGMYLAAEQQPRYIPGVRERWKFIEPTLNKCPTPLKGVPMIGSLGCPYTCSFCIDSEVDYQPLDFDQITEDLRFVAAKMSNPWVVWHDPNFGVRFDDYLGAIENAVPAGTMSFAAESSLSLLSEPKLKRLNRAGFKAMLPGIESWYELGNKARTGKLQGLDKVNQVSDHINMVLRYIPYVQTNFVLGLDVDQGTEPFELTKQFLDKTPGTFPGYSLLSAFGEAAPLNLEFQRAGRVRGFPFHFLNNNQAMNVVPKNYTWTEFYDLVIDLTKYSFSWRSIGRRALGTSKGFPMWLNFVRAISSEGFGRIKYYGEVRKRLESDRSFRDFFEGESDKVPGFYLDRMKRDLGPLYELLPDGALTHDPNAYLAKSSKPDPSALVGISMSS